MKTPRSFLLGLGLLLTGLPLPAQDAAETTSAATSASPQLDPGQLDELLGPIALYPDALIALILPAAAVPSDVVLAARYLQGGGDVAQIENQPWDDSVEALAHYPDVIQWMDQNLAWTKQLGEVFVAQPVDVMQSVQRLRTEARAAGTLTDTPEQQIVTEGDDISIVPAQPDVIYVPRYDPDVVYYTQPAGYYSGPFLTFGAAYSTGLWLTYDMDWGHRRIWVVDHHDRHYDWRDHRDWRHPVFPGRPGYVSDPNRHPWKPPANYPIARPPIRTGPPHVVRPGVLPGAPPRPPNWRRDGTPDRRPDNTPRGQAAPPRGSNPPRPGQLQSPLPQPFQSPLPQPLQPPLPPATRPTQPARPSQPAPEHRGGPNDQGGNDGRRGRELRGSPGNRFMPPSRPTPPPAASAPPPPAPANRPPQPPQSQPSPDDDRRRERDRDHRN